MFGYVLVASTMLYTMFRLAYEMGRREILLRATVHIVPNVTIKHGQNVKRSETLLTSIGIRRPSWEIGLRIHLQKRNNELTTYISRCLNSLLKSFVDH